MHSIPTDAFATIKNVGVVYLSDSISTYENTENTAPYLQLPLVLIINVDVIYLHMQTL